MRLTQTLTLNDRTITIKELTVGEIRAWLKALENPAQTDVADLALMADFRVSDLTVMTDLSAADFDSMAPSELRQVWDKCREVNGDFFGLMGRLEVVGQAALKNSAVS